MRRATMTHRGHNVTLINDREGRTVGAHFTVGQGQYELTVDLSVDHMTVQVQVCATLAPCFNADCALWTSDILTIDGCDELALTEALSAAVDSLVKWGQAAASKLYADLLELSKDPAFGAHLQIK